MIMWRMQKSVTDQEWTRYKNREINETNERKKKPSKEVPQMKIDSRGIWIVIFL